MKTKTIAAILAAVLLASQFPVIGDSADGFGSWQPESVSLATDEDIGCVEDCTAPAHPFADWAEWADAGCTEESAANDADCIAFAKNHK